MANLDEEYHYERDMNANKAVWENSYAVQQNMRELLGAIFIQEQRNYDMLSIIADKLGADAKGLFNLHESGQILAPAPSFIFQVDAENEADQNDQLELDLD